MRLAMARGNGIEFTDDILHHREQRKITILPVPVAKFAFQSNARSRLTNAPENASSIIEVLGTSGAADTGLANIVILTSGMNDTMVQMA